MTPSSAMLWAHCSLSVLLYTSYIWSFNLMHLWSEADWLWGIVGVFHFWTFGPIKRPVVDKWKKQNAERRDVSWCRLNFLAATVGVTLPLLAIEHQGHPSKLPKSTPHNGSCFVNCMGLSLLQDHGRTAPLVSTLLLNCNPLQATQCSVSGKFKSCTTPWEIGLISE